VHRLKLTRRRSIGAKERLQSLTFAISMIYRQPAPPKNEQVKFKFQKLIKEENVSVYI
jgi:hypothetical protein